MTERPNVSGLIYLRHEDGLIPMREAPYDAEELLQRLIADHPDLLAGDQIDPESPRRWMLIDREVGIADGEARPDRWSLDHLFVDHDGIPTLIEVKRSSDTRIRREVVGQMLDYAANLSRYWPPDEIRRRFEERCGTQGIDPAAEIARSLGDIEPDGFWERVTDHLASRRMRLLFVADVIPPDLQAIIEFLNEGLTRIEVLGVEVRQFTGAGRQTLVPRVIGRTAVASERKRPPASSPKVTWSLEAYRDHARTTSTHGARITEEALEWLRVRSLPIDIGNGRSGPLYLAVPGPGERVRRLLAIYPDARLEINYMNIRARPGLDTAAARHQLRRAFEEALGTPLPAEAAERGTWCAVRPEVVSEPGCFPRVLAVLDRVAAGEVA